VLLLCDPLSVLSSAPDAGVQSSLPWNWDPIPFLVVGNIMNTKLDKTAIARGKFFSSCLVSAPALGKKHFWSPTSLATTEKHDRREEGVHPVQRTEAPLLEFRLKAQEQLQLFLLRLVEHVEATRRGHTIVDPAFVDDAVREGEEDAGGREEGDQRQAKPLVGSVALAVVCEGCRQRLVCRH
jgi:hypothetical protein